MQQQHRHPVPIFPKCLQMGTGANAHLGERGTPSALCLFSPNVCKSALGKCALGENGHLGERSTPRALKGTPKCPMPICSDAHLQTFWKMDTGHLGYSFRSLGVAYPFPQMPIFPKCPFVLVPISQEPIFCTKYSFSPRANLPQSPIYFGAHLPRMLICHLSGAHLPKMSVYSKFSISPKYPFASLPTCHSALHFPKSPLAPVPIRPKYPIVQDPNAWDPSVRDPIVWAPIIRDHSFWCPFVRDPIAWAPIIRDHSSWCPFVRDPIVWAPIIRDHSSWCPFVRAPIVQDAFVLVSVCPGAHLSGNQMFENRLLHRTPAFDDQQAFASVWLSLDSAILIASTLSFPLLAFQTTYCRDCGHSLCAIASRLYDTTRALHNYQACCEVLD